MINPFKSHIPNIIFDVRSPAVTEEVISQWRTSLENEKTRLFVRAILMRALAIASAAVGVWAAFTVDTLLGKILALCIGSAAFVSFISSFSGEEDGWVDINLNRLRPLDVTAEPQEYISLAQWCAQDAVLAAYQQGWVEQKRLPVAGEYAAMRQWVNQAGSRMKNAQMVEQACAARGFLIGEATCREI